MKPVNPKHFYATEWAWADARCRQRIETMMRGMGRPLEAVRVLREDEIEPAVRANQWNDLDIRQGRLRFEGDPDVVFNKFRWMADEEQKSARERLPILKDLKGYTHGFVRALYGFPDFFHFEDGHHKRKREVCCWSLYDLHSARGCFHKCQYCRRGRVLTLMLDVEEFIEHVDQLMARTPWQKVYRYDVETDCLTLEPEYGMCRALVEHYAAIEDRYIILFSKSDNVDFLLGLEHKGHAIMLWTLSTPTVSRLIERDTATTEQRLAAARKCQDAGYAVRFKFKPIIPIADWRAEATAMLEMLFDMVEPDNLSMEMLFFDSTAELKQVLAPSLFAPEFLQALERHEAAGLMTDNMHPIPHELRAEVYVHYADEVKRLSPGTRLSVCAETTRMWERMGPRLGMCDSRFVCNCGPVCVPHVTANRVSTPDGAIAVLD